MKQKSTLRWILENLPVILAGVALFTIVIMETAQCIYRYTLSHTFNFVDDVAVVCFSWTIFAGAAAAYKAKLHYGLDVLINAIPVKHKAKYMVVLDTLVMLAFAYFFYYSVVLFANVGPKILMTTGISYRWVDGGLVYGMLMMLIYSIEFLIDDIKKLTNNTDESKEGTKCAF